MCSELSGKYGKGKRRGAAEADEQYRICGTERDIIREGYVNHRIFRIKFMKRIRNMHAAKAAGVSFAVIALSGVLALGGCSGGRDGSVDPTPTPTAAAPTVAATPTENSTKPTEEPTPTPGSVTILGTEYDRDTTFLDLSACESSDVPEICEAIGEMPELETINLMDGDDSSGLSLKDVRALMDAAPDAHYIYRFDLFGHRLAVSDTVIRYKDEEIGNEGVGSLREALAVLGKGCYFVLDDCGIDDEVMARLRTEFPDIKLVWRVHVGKKSALTDDTIIRMTHGIDDTMTAPLKYCTETVYMDLGHDSGISDISFISNMHKLECLILSGSSVSDISPLQYCPALTWLELANCGRVKDIAPVSGMDSIKYLNISYTGIRDITPVMKMKLDRLCCVGNGISEESSDQFIEAHPDCMVAFTGNPWGYAWRYDDHGYHFFSYYARMREVFRYETYSPGGFKYPEYEEPENVYEDNDPRLNPADGEEPPAEEGEEEAPAEEAPAEETPAEEAAPPEAPAAIE